MIHFMLVLLGVFLFSFSNASAGGNQTPANASASPFSGGGSITAIANQTQKNLAQDKAEEPLPNTLDLEKEKWIREGLLDNGIAKLRLLLNDRVQSLLQFSLQQKKIIHQLGHDSKTRLNHLKRYLDIPSTYMVLNQWAKEVDAQITQHLTAKQLEALNATKMCIIVAYPAFLAGDWAQRVQSVLPIRLEPMQAVAIRGLALQVFQIESNTRRSLLNAAIEYRRRERYGYPYGISRSEHDSIVSEGTRLLANAWTVFDRVSELLDAEQKDVFNTAKESCEAENLTRATLRDVIDDALRN